MAQKIPLADKLRNQYLKFYDRWFMDYVFIHINKTAGSSIEQALGLPREHKTVREKIRQLGAKEWARRYSFAFVRNPWDKVVSHYNFRVMTNQTELGTSRVPFDEWVKRTYGMQDPKYYDKPKMFQPQTEWLTDSEGVIAVDFIGRFEDLLADFEKISVRLGIEATLPHYKKSSQRSYRGYYDDATYDIVFDWFASDIKEFGYSFDGYKGS